MKFNRILCFVTLLCLMSSVTAYAVAFRDNPAKDEADVSRAGSNDIIYEDFTEVEEGILPSNAKGTTNTGYVTTAYHKYNGKDEKNCLEIADTSHDTQYSGPMATFTTGGQSARDGLVGLEFRYKYIPESTSTYSGFTISLNGTAGCVSKIVVASKNGLTNFNGSSGRGEKTIDASRLSADTWYTAKYIIDFDNQELDLIFTNEGTGVKKMLANAVFHTSATVDDLKEITFYSQMYGGKWIVDYIKITEEAVRLEDTDEYNNDIKKGVEPTYADAPKTRPVEGRLNILYGGVYMYTTVPPIRQKDKTLVSAKNCATVLSMAYYRTDGNYIIQDAENKFVFSSDGTQAQYNGKELALSAECIFVNKQLMIPMEDILSVMGYSYLYDSIKNELIISEFQMNVISE